MTLSRSQDGYPRALSRSPERPNRNVIDRNRSEDLAFNDRESENELEPPLLTPALLMPPPTTLLGDLRHRATMLVHRASQNRERFAMMAKLGLFLLKMATLQQVCWPYTVGRLVGTSLFAAAAVELVVPWLGEDVGHSGGRIAGFGKGPDMDMAPPATDHAGLGTQEEPADVSSAGGEMRPRVSPRTTSRHETLYARRRGAWGWTWGWRVSVLLLVVHYLILGVTSRYGALCAVPVEEEWSRW